MSDKKQSTIKTILEALATLKGSDPSLVKALSEDVTVDPSLVAAKGEIDSHRSAGLGSKTEYVKDGWSEGMVNKSPTREEINIGPGEESSGRGAEKMVRDYSNPAPQHHGIEQAVERFGAMFEGFGKSMLSQQAAFLKAIQEDNKAIKALVVQSIIAKGESEDDEEEDEEESEVVEINASRAKSKIEEAKKLIKALKKATTDEDKAKIRKALIKALESANFAVTLCKSEDITKAFAAVLAKADINVVQEEEEDEEEEEEAGKAKSAAVTDDAGAAKAKKDDQGNQADREDPTNGNQAAAAKAQAAELAKTQTQITDALKGLATLETSVKGMMDIVMGRTKIAETLPDIAKAKPDAITALIANIHEMQDSGTITPADAAAALDIASQTRHAAAGNLDQAIVKSRLEKSSNTVRTLFANALKAEAA